MNWEISRRLDGKSKPELLKTLTKAVLAIALLAGLLQGSAYARSASSMKLGYYHLVAVMKKTGFTDRGAQVVAYKRGKRTFYLRLRSGRVPLSEVERMIKESGLGRVARLALLAELKIRRGSKDAPTGKQITKASRKYGYKWVQYVGFAKGKKSVYFQIEVGDDVKVSDIKAALEQAEVDSSKSREILGFAEKIALNVVPGGHKPKLLGTVTYFDLIRTLVNEFGFSLSSVSDSSSSAVQRFTRGSVVVDFPFEQGSAIVGHRVLTRAFSKATDQGERKPLNSTKVRVIIRTANTLALQRLGLNIELPY